jgi:signal transduction histidine kinase/CheY-like chemotaxis protein
VQRLHERMLAEPVETRLWVEYLDSVRAPRIPAEFRAWYTARWGGRRFSAIVALDDNAIRYVFEHGDLFGTATPVVYGGLNSAALRDELPRGRFTGVFEDFTLGSILEMARRLHPERRRGVVIHDGSSTSRALARGFRDETVRKVGLEFEFWNGSELAEVALAGRLERLQPDQLVFLLPVNSFRDQAYVPSQRAVSLVAARSQGPVYGIGVEDPSGLLFCSTANMGQVHGDFVAQQLVRLLAGEPPERIAVIADTLIELVFDYRQLGRWSVEPASLPKRARLAHEPDGLLYRYGRWVAVAVLSAVAQTAIILLLVANIWRRRRAERALQRALEAEQASSKVKGEFLANMSHELRTPLNGLLGMSQLLLDSPLSEEQRSSVDAIQNCGGSLMNLLNDILEHSRLAAGQVRHRPRSTDIVQQSREVVQMLEPAAARAGLSLRIENAEETPRFVVVDPYRVKQVLTNLISNAIKFTPNGSVTLLIEPEEEWLRFEVRDTGMGIRREDQERIFERFQQAEQSGVVPSGGAGLGLTICSQVVTAMGGRIGVRSEPGEGSTFWFVVPLRLPAGEPAPEAEPAASALPDGSGMEGMRVLLVEDNATSSLVIERTLTKRGCRLTCMGDGLQAVEEATRSVFDVILMDIQLPGLDGSEAIRRIRAAPGGSRNALIVALTAFAFEEDRERSLAAGADDHITKPVDLRSLLVRMCEPRQASA